jgi:hypothetical protein
MKYSAELIHERPDGTVEVLEVVEIEADNLFSLNERVMALVKDGRLFSIGGNAIRIRTDDFTVVFEASHTEGN